MHIIIEHMFLMLHGHHYVHAGVRISCDHGQSWVVACKAPEGLCFTRDTVTSFETRRREVQFHEYRARMHRVLSYGMVTREKA